MIKARHLFVFVIIASILALFFLLVKDSKSKERVHHTNTPTTETATKPEEGFKKETAPDKETKIHTKEIPEKIPTTTNQHLMSSFTTYHPCCANRVENIQRMAELAHDTKVEPDELFSLNSHIGERTEEKGFVPAGTIMAGELVDTVGGGVSQFATTLYNAVYWAGLQDISHIPHSWSFSRYPTGIEATISWPRPDLIFKNNTSDPIVIKTSYTDTSITVEIWGNNDGRTLIGTHKDGTTNTEVVNEGGPSSRIVESYVTPTYAEINKIPTFVYPNIAIRRGFEIQMKAGTPGKIMNVFRTITENGHESIDTWKVIYKPTPKEIHVHPCELEAKQRTHEYDKYDYSYIDCSKE